jgi:ATPase family associated with various cellular activities (AAA)/AAA+ lid domain
VTPLLDQLGLLVSARYPLLLLYSHEEERVLRAVGRQCERDGLALYRWSCVRGLCDPSGVVIADTVAVEGALREIEARSEPALFLMLDLHPHLWNANVVRRLRELTELLGRRRQAIAMVGANLEVPPELRHDLRIIDIPLPAYDEVARLLGMLLAREGITLEPERFDQFVKGALGLTEREVKRLYARVLLGGGRFSEPDLQTLVDEKRQAIRRSQQLEFWDSAGRVEDVGGMDNLKTWLGQRALAFRPEARAYGLPEPRGLFMLGVQGCGKSLMAKAVADLWKLPLLRLDVAAVFGSQAGAELGLRETIKVAESLAPVVLWIDELEKGFASAGSTGGDAFGWFLTWMQEKQATVFVVATANEVRLLPPELLRKGRFDEIFFVDLPNAHERLAILRIHLGRRGRQADDFDLVTLAEECEKFSGAELEQVVVAAMFLAYAKGRALLTEDLVDAAREMVPLAVTMDDRLKELREWARPRARRASLDRRRVDFFAEWEEAT